MIGFLGNRRIAQVLMFVLLLCNVASAKNSSEIEIYGKLENLKEHVVEIIFRWKSEGRYYKDSCSVKNGKYYFKAKISEPTQFSLRAKYLSKSGKPFFKIVNDSGEGISFFLEPKIIQLTSIDSFTNTICSGSETNKILQDFARLTLTTPDVETRARGILLLLNYTAADSLNKLERISDSISLDDDLKNYKQNAKTVLAPMLLNRLYDQRYPVDSIKALFNIMSEEYKQASSAVLLLKNLNNYSRLAIEQSFEWPLFIDTSGKKITIRGTDHKLIFVDFWASWCAPCRAQTEPLRKVYSNFHGRGFEIVAVSLDEKLSSWKKAIVDDKLPWINVSDLKGWNNQLIVKYYIDSIPFNILINADGKIIAFNVSMEELLEKCEAFLPSIK